MSMYEEEMQKITSFIDENKDLVDSALRTVSISILNTLNVFNIIENKITIIIANYYKMSYSPELDFRVDILDAGYLSYGQKVKILDSILERCGYYTSIKSDSKTYLSPFKIVGDLRNNIIHSVYGIDPDRIKGKEPRMIIYANGRKISKKDLLKVFADFETYSQKSDAILNDIAKCIAERNSD